MSDLGDFSVGHCLVRPSLSQILDGDREVHVEPRSIDVLIALVERAGEVCPKKELIEAVWGDSFVSDEVLTHAIWDLRRAFGDDAGHPRFIQTIPKRGYRLIAPVTVPEPEPEPAGPATVARWAAVALVALAFAVAFFWWRGDGGPRAPRAERRLLVVQPSADAAHAEVGQRLYDDLLIELAGSQGVEVVPAERCEPSPAAAVTFCLTVDVRGLDERFEVRPRLSDAKTGEIAWAPARSLTMSHAPGGSRSAASELESLVKTYLRIIELDVYHDDDIKPWFDFSRHDTRAIGDFLEGVYYVYTNQQGGRTPMDPAAERDPSFIAPRVWRIPTLADGGGDPERLRAYLDDLRRLYETADPFEGAMIQWALAVAEGNVKRQLLELKIALEQEPANRPVRFTLGAAMLENGNPEGAWELLEPLANQRWRFPGLYTAAAACAILLERPERAREFLDYAASRSPVDAESLALLELLAIYRGDAEAAAGFRERMQTRIDELDEPYRFDPAPFAAKLAALALDEGRDEIANELREFPD